MDIKEVIKLREQGKTLQQIADEFSVTKQFVSQRMRRAGYQGGLLTRHKFKCNHCGKEFLSRFANKESYAGRNRFCSLTCGSQYKRPSPIYLGIESIEMFGKYNPGQDMKKSRFKVKN